MAFICLLSIVINREIVENPLRSASRLRYFLIAFLSYFSFFYLKRDYLNRKRISWLLHLLLGSTMIAAVVGVVAIYTRYNILKMEPACLGYRTCGLYNLSITYGYGLGLLMILLTGAVIQREYFKKWIHPWMLYGAWLFNIVAFWMTYTRGAWIGFLISTPFFLVKRGGKAIVFLVSSYLLGGILIFSFSEQARQQVFERKDSNSERLAFFKAALRASTEKPLWGYGYKNFEPYSREIRERYKIETSEDNLGHAHNNFLEHLASTGIIGLIAFLAFCFFWLKETYQREKFIFPFVLGFIVSGMTQYTFGDAENLFLILGIFSLF